MPPTDVPDTKPVRKSFPAPLSAKASCTANMPNNAVREYRHLFPSPARNAKSALQKGTFLTGTTPLSFRFIAVIFASIPIPREETIPIPLTAIFILSAVFGYVFRQGFHRIEHRFGFGRILKLDAVILL